MKLRARIDGFLNRLNRHREPIVKKKVFVFEHHAIVRQAIVDKLNRQRDLSVCGEAEDVVFALTAIGAAMPDLVLADIQLKASDGIELIRELRRLYPLVPVVAMTMFEFIRYEQGAFAAGAIGFVVKQEGLEKITEGIRHALDQSKRRATHEK